MNCAYCNQPLQPGVGICPACGSPTGQAAISPAVSVAPAGPTGSPAVPAAAFSGQDPFRGASAAPGWAAFVQQGGYSLKAQFNGGLKVICGGREVAFLTVGQDDAAQSQTFDLVERAGGVPACRFIRTSKTMSGVDPASRQTLFTWERLSSAGGELFTGSKWRCGELELSQSAVRSLFMWIPRISWFIPTKYTISAGGRGVGRVDGTAFSFSNSKTAVVLDPSKAWEIMAAAIILSEDELG